MREDRPRDPVFEPRPREWAGRCCRCFDYTLNPVVFIASVLIIWGFIVWCICEPDAKSKIEVLQDHLVRHFSWLYIGGVVLFLVLMLFLMIHPTVCYQHKAATDCLHQNPSPRLMACSAFPDQAGSTGTAPQIQPDDVVLDAVQRRIRKRFIFLRRHRDRAAFQRQRGGME